QGKKIDHVDEAPMGDIAAIAKLKDVHTGDTLVGGKHKLVIQLPALPPPQITFRVAPKKKGDEDKIGVAIQRIHEEDPSIHSGHDELTSELTLSGVGVAHLDVTLEKMARKY